MKKYVIIFRRGKLFIDGWHWLYSCTCNNHHVSFCETLGSVLDTKYEGKINMKKCLFLALSLNCYLLAVFMFDC